MDPLLSGVCIASVVRDSHEYEDFAMSGETSAEQQTADEVLSSVLALSDESLRRLVTEARSEIAARLLASGDLSAVADEAFSNMFGADGLPLDPRTGDGILICAGGKVDRSAMSHRCRFVRVAGGWVWEHPEVLGDTVRHISKGPRRSMRSVTLVPLFEGDEVDLITCRTRNAVHELLSVRSFIVAAGSLLLVSARSVSRTDHR